MLHPEWNGMVFRNISLILARNMDFIYYGIFSDQNLQKCPIISFCGGFQGLSPPNRKNSTQKHSVHDSTVYIILSILQLHFQTIKIIMLNAYLLLLLFIWCCNPLLPVGDSSFWLVAFDDDDEWFGFVLLLLDDVYAFVLLWRRNDLLPDLWFCNVFDLLSW